VGLEKERPDHEKVITSHFPSFTSFHKSALLKYKKVKVQAINVKKSLIAGICG